MSSLLTEWRTALAEGGQTAAMIFADHCNDLDTEESNRLASLIRRYYDIQSYVRMSLPIPPEMVDDFQSLNASFSPEPRRYLEESTNNWFFDPLGPMYMAFECTYPDLKRNMDWLSQEPVRRVMMRACQTDDDFESVIGNYRMQTVEELNLSFRVYRGIVSIPVVVAAIRRMNAPNLKLLALHWVRNDRLNLVKTAFATNATIPAKAVLMMDGRPVVSK